MVRSALWVYHRAALRADPLARVSNHECDRCLILRDAAEGPLLRMRVCGCSAALGILAMTIADKLVLQRQHHLKWRAFDRLGLILMMLCGLLCFGFSLSVTADIVTRTIGHPWLWLQEVTSTLFIYAIFIGAGVATRRNDHLYLTAIAEALHGTPRLIVEIIIRLVVLGVAFCLIWFGYINYLRGFGSFRLPSGTPIASLYAAIPLAGLLIGLFAVEHLVNGIRNGFDHPEPPEDDADIRPADAIPPTRVAL